MILRGTLFENATASDCDDASFYYSELDFELQFKSVIDNFSSTAHRQG